mmetsp:Transcript_66308/g.110158  ORF Transcript_66308/g.110158 Transcript_66308/m.110158 type:complete len:285 (-) Transcript_66308:32-886(-)|eukprot:CAMPEP_0119307154 /NCGR_PEP_ID=MMETSP1333-20130426/7726_1 /TAXON_ID=418940 /ORGANISM="Scyphosphaera apsteinii, Strain RCC1455" /LENGTH=284 /DNA_ID=CAMNT_0007310631 /DNA_START=286 /DNA_END=1140 /DNA_ORIENTATION=+
MTDDAGGEGHGGPPPLDKWLTRPVMLRVKCGTNSSQQVGFNDPGSVFKIDTPHFVGRMYFRLRNLPGEPADYFAGRNRRLSAVIQGHFKHRTCMSDCYTGYEFSQRFRNVPAPWLISAAMRLIRKIAPTMTADITGSRPYFLNPLFQTIQLMDVSEAGHEPHITSPLEENNALLGGKFAAGKLDSEGRKSYFASVSSGAMHTLDPRYVYTMEFFEDKVDMSTFELILLGMRFSLRRFIGCQPLQIMGLIGNKAHSGQYLWNVEMWHESAVDAGDGEMSHVEHGA